MTTAPPFDHNDRITLRKQLKAQRHDLSSAVRINAAQALAEQIKTLAIANRPGYVAGYWASSGEMPLLAVQLGLQASQIWCLPLIREDGTLGFAPWRSGDPLSTNRYGIPEPDVSPSSQLDISQMQIVLMPLLGFDRNGFRLGMGGGYYDRTLAAYRDRPAPPWRIGVAYAFQEIAIHAPSPWDVPLHAIVTETEASMFSQHTR